MNRRTVLRQSAKLAYATPLVVASMGMSQVHATDVGCSCPDVDPCYAVDVERDCVRVLHADCPPIEPQFICPD